MFIFCSAIFLTEALGYSSCEYLVDTGKMYLTPLPEDLPASIMAKGYSAEVAQKLVSNRPDIVKRILVSGSGEAERLYRGLGISIEDFDPQKKIDPNDPNSRNVVGNPNDFWFSKIPGTALHYAVLRSVMFERMPANGIILELDVPTFALSEKRTMLGNNVQLVSKWLAGDMTPFINRIGILNGKEVGSEVLNNPNPRVDYNDFVAEWLQYP